MNQRVIIINLLRLTLERTKYLKFVILNMLDRLNDDGRIGSHAPLVNLYMWPFMKISYMHHNTYLLDWELMHSRRSWCWWHFNFSPDFYVKLNFQVLMKFLKYEIILLNMGVCLVVKNFLDLRTFDFDK